MYITREKIETTYTEGFDDLCQLLLDCGWVEVDTVSSILRVFMSDGESGVEFPIYAELGIYSQYIRMTLWTHWDSIGHVGVCPLNTGVTMTPSGFTSYRFYCSKDIINIRGASGVFVRLNPADRLKLVTQSAIVGGASVTIELDDVSELIVGDKYNILGILGEGQQEIAVTAKDSGLNTVTVTGCTNSYAAGALFGRSLSPCFIVSSSIKYNPFNFNRNGLSISTSPALTAKGKFGEVGAVYSFENRVILEPLIATDTYRYIGTFPVQIKYGKYQAALNDVVLVDNSTVNTAISTPTSFTDYTFTDELQNWEVDSLIGKCVYFVSGTGVGYSRYIISNTANTLTFRTILPTITVATGYVIADEVYRYVNSVIGNYYYYTKEEF